jgi:hypothetical protein
MHSTHILLLTAVLTVKGLVIHSSDAFLLYDLLCLPRCSCACICACISVQRLQVLDEVGNVCEAQMTSQITSAATAAAATAEEHTKTVLQLTAAASAADIRHAEEVLALTAAAKAAAEEQATKVSNYYTLESHA